eukprot:TCONS_00072737-protein
MDSGIKIEKTSLESLQDFKEIAKNPYDFVILKIRPIADAPPPKGNRSPPEEVAIIKSVMKGESAKEYEGQHGDIPAIYYAVHQYFKESQDDCAIAVFYIEYPLPSGATKSKLIAINWCPDTAKMQLKMRYSSTFKTVCNKAPKLNAKVEAHDMDDISYKAVVNQVSK